jgi:hypothetical protein
MRATVFYWKSFLSRHIPVGRPSLAAHRLAGIEARPTEILQFFNGVPDTCVPPWEPPILAKKFAHPEAQTPAIHMTDNPVDGKLRRISPGIFSEIV